MQIFNPSLARPVEEVIRVRVLFGAGTALAPKFEAPTVEVARATALLAYGITPDRKGEFTDPQGGKVCLEYVFPSGSVYRERFLGNWFKVFGPDLSQTEAASWFGYSGNTR